MPTLVVSTMPSGSTRLTVTFLYSFPSIVLKSSAKAKEERQAKAKQATAVIFMPLNLESKKRLAVQPHSHDPVAIRFRRQGAETPQNLINKFVLVVFEFDFP